MKKVIKPSDIQRLAKICKEINERLSFKNPIVDDDSKKLERESKKFKKLLEYNIPDDDLRDVDDTHEIKESEGVYENIVFMQNPSDTDEFFDVLNGEGPEAALEYLKQWHMPGEHEIVTSPGHGSLDKTFKQGKYIMSYNQPLGYAGLVYEV